MYENIAGKLKIIAKLLGLISILGFAYFLYVAVASGGEPIIIAICALFAVLFIFSFPIYGIGELVGEVKQISKSLKIPEISAKEIDDKNEQ